METHGIFGNERVMQFLITMKALAEQCFRQLHRVSHERQCEPAVAAESFRVGLRYMSSWNDSIMEQEATHAIAKYPDIVSNYKYTLVHYVKLTHRDKRAEVQLSVPPFKQFLHWFLVRISTSSQLQDNISPKRAARSNTTARPGSTARSRRGLAILVAGKARGMAGARHPE